jgi:nucleoside phosphorylase
VVAVLPEAEPLVRRYRMEPQQGAFRWYRSPGAEEALVVSGIGNLAAASAASFLHAKTGEYPAAVWLNVGSAGHRDRPPGDLVVAHTVTDAASGDRFYPTRLDGPDLHPVEVRTVVRAERAFDSDAVYDMEAYGFLAAARRFSTSELVQSIKIVSDNAGSTIAAWSWTRVRSLVESRAEEVARAAERYREIARELEPLCREEAATRELVEAYRSRTRFTTSEARRLKSLLLRLRVLDPEASRDGQGITAPEILEKLELRIRSLAAES